MSRKMVGIGMKILPSISLFSIYLMGERSISFPRNEDSKKRKETIDLTLHHKLDGVTLISEMLEKDI